MFGCESWTIKKAESQKTCFWPVALEKTLESPLNYKEIKPVNPKGHQSWIFIGKTDAELNLQYFGYLMQRTDSLEKTLMLGKIEGRRRRGWQWMRSLDASFTPWTWVWASSGWWWKTGRPGLLKSIVCQSVGHTEWLNNNNTYNHWWDRDHFNFTGKKTKAYKRCISTSWS